MIFHKFCETAHSNIIQNTYIHIDMTSHNMIISHESIYNEKLQIFTNIENNFFLPLIIRIFFDICSSNPEYKP